jgi:cobalamin biosynthesis Mg chelatase CobN
VGAAAPVPDFATPVSTSGTSLSATALSGSDKGRDVMERRPGGEVVETAREARQGYLDRPVLLVLVVSTALAVLVLGILWFGGVWSGGA